MSAGEYEEDVGGGLGAEAGNQRELAGAPEEGDAAFERLFQQLAAGEAEAGTGGGSTSEPTGVAGRDVGDKSSGASQIFAAPADHSPRGAASLAFSAAEGSDATPLTGEGAARNGVQHIAEAEAPSGEGPGEFTRIFTLQPKPSSPPPAILAVVAPHSGAARPATGLVARSAGAAESGSRASIPAPPASAPEPRVGAESIPGAAMDGSEQAFAAATATFLAGGASAGGAGPSARLGATQPLPVLRGPVAPEAGEASVVAPGEAAPEITPIAGQGGGLPTAAGGQKPGEFTQFFQALAPAKAEVAGPSNAAVSGLAPGDRAFAAAAPMPSAEALAAPAVAASEPQRPAPAAAQPGAFTAFFQAPAAGAGQNAGTDAGWAPAAAPPRADAPGGSGAKTAPAAGPARSGDFAAAFAEPASKPAGGFTELLQSLSGEPGGKSTSSGETPASGGAQGAFGGPPAAAAPGAFRPPAPVAGAREDAPFSPRAAAPQATPAARAGEFTELLQSLQAAPVETKPAPAARTPFFEEGRNMSAGGPSEFTRIMQGSAARSAQAPIPAFAPAPAAQASAPAVGLPIAAPPALPKPELPTAAVKTKLQTLMPWLLAANGALLLVLIAIAILFLRHHH